MWAYDLRSWSQAFHRVAARPMPMLVRNTRRLCPMTPSASGTAPNFFLMIRLSSAPCTPVSSAAGMRAMSPPRLSVLPVQTPGGEVL